MTRHNQRRFLSTVFAFTLLFYVENEVYVQSLTVAVFGGSGFVGRRISHTLIDAGCDVISISRSGKPPPYYCNDGDEIESSSSRSLRWADDVTWVKYDLDPAKNPRNNDALLSLPKIDAAISCIGNVQPDREWEKSTFFGLAFNETRLFYENGILNEYAIKIAKEAGAERFVFITTSYEVSKMLEGPIPGYIYGKRHAEHIAYENFGIEDDNAFLLGPSFVYGGKRFNKFGDIYKAFVKSNVAKMYVGGNDKLRNLSVSPLEDWVEKSLFSPPVKVDVVARVACAAALGFVTRNMVGDRRQGFYDTCGKPVVYDNLIFVDGTEKLEEIDDFVVKELKKRSRNDSEDISSSEALREFKHRHTELGYSDQYSSTEPVFEGALIGKGPFLYPVPVVVFFSSIFYLMTSGKLIVT